MPGDNRTKWILAVGVGLFGILAGLTPRVQTLEEALGLKWLYRMRGPAPAPADVVVVALDRASARGLELPVEPRKWPRSLHARLIRQLSAEGARVIVFDLLFSDPQDAGTDAHLAEAMAAAGNVILTQRVVSEKIHLKDAGGGSVGDLFVQKLVDPLPVFAKNTLALAPFPLPSISLELNRYWLFLPGERPLPTLPTVVLHACAPSAWQDLLAALSIAPAASKPLSAQGAGGGIVSGILALKERVETDPKVAAALDRLLAKEAAVGESPSLFGAVARVYQGPVERYLNLYGPAGTVETISYQMALRMDPSQTPFDFRGKIVFVGLTEGAWPIVKDGFRTVFSKDEGLDIPGVEVAASAVANLMENKSVRPVGTLLRLGIVMAWGMLVMTLFLERSPIVAGAGFGMTLFLYAALSVWHFGKSGLWYPMVVPLVLQAPSAAIGAWVLKYRKLSRERRNIRDAFGYYLPDTVVERLSRSSRSLQSGDQILFGICMFTDAERYTAVSEAIEPSALYRLMNAYYGVIYGPIKANGGMVLQTIGDSILAMWPAPDEDPRVRAKACRAALGVLDAVHAFNENAGPWRLPTRIGMHAGYLQLGSIGAMDHFEYRPVGDMVNTASRLEGLNKHLGTRALVSAETIDGLEGFSTRCLGTFLFVGKTIPTTVFELMGEEKHAEPGTVAACRFFERALGDFKRGNWEQARRGFMEVLALMPDDGPAAFYLNEIDHCRRRPSVQDWTGAVVLRQK